MSMVSKKRTTRTVRFAITIIMEITSGRARPVRLYSQTAMSRPAGTPMMGSMAGTTRKIRLVRLPRQRRLTKGLGKRWPPLPRP